MQHIMIAALLPLVTPIWTSVMYTIYGIKNCSTMKKALTWLNENVIDYQFHDYKTEGLSLNTLASLIQLAGWEELLNRKGMTWRKLDESVRASITNAETAQKIMLKNPSIIKRPLLIKDNRVLLGFSESAYQQFIDNTK